MHVTAIIAAGGAGRRIVRRQPKQLLDIGGRIDAGPQRQGVRFASAVSDLVVVVPPRARRATRRPYIGRRRVRPLASWPAASAGRTRSRTRSRASIRRPTSCSSTTPRGRSSAPELIDRTIDAAAAHGAAIAALEAQRHGQARRAPSDGALIVETIPRERSSSRRRRRASAATCWRAAVALGRAGVEATDEAALAERAGHRARRRQAIRAT